MTDEQAERLVSALERAVDLFARWYDKRYPIEEPPSDAEIFDPRESRITDPQSRAEYDALPADMPGRFTQLIERAKNSN